MARDSRSVLAASRFPLPAPRFPLPASWSNQKVLRSDVSQEVPIEDSLDLHAFNPRDIPSVVDEYVTAAHTAGFRLVRLIHGRGKGVQRAVVQSVLDHHPLVVEFWDAQDAHLGATVARLINSVVP